MQLRDLDLRDLKVSESCASERAVISFLNVCSLQFTFDLGLVEGWLGAGQKVAERRNAAVFLLPFVDASCCLTTCFPAYTDWNNLMIVFSRIRDTSSFMSSSLRDMSNTQTDAVVSLFVISVWHVSLTVSNPGESTGVFRRTNEKQC